MKLGTHKMTGNQVAIKTVGKENMIPLEIFQARLEIEVLKVC